MGGFLAVVFFIALALVTRTGAVAAGAAAFLAELLVIAILVAIDLLRVVVRGAFLAAEERVGITSSIQAMCSLSAFFAQFYRELVSRSLFEWALSQEVKHNPLHIVPRDSRCHNCVWCHSAIE